MSPRNRPTERGRYDDVLVVRDLRKVFPARGGGRDVVAVDDVSFDVRRGQTWGLIGESGSGKTTTGRMVLGLEPATGGSVDFDGTEIVRARPKTLQALRRRVRMVFQDSGSAFNPRRPVGDQIAYGLHRYGIASGAEARARTVALVERVGLEASHLDRYVHEFSGGQRQRLGIARALVTDPDFVVLDEPTAALDVSVQAQVLNLLKDLQAERGLTLLLVTHHLALVEHMCDHAGVLEHGHLVESGPVDRLLTDPRTDTTRALLDAVLEPTA
ncbi:ATP-binding cassette domain-containing protein [Kineococcus sp. SYSU DK006]|uniref:ATP-binding cassette domain-containing protein n=1 Tax=Kineococcus sp. SYSU DK006 TaxID=3383127 RepID=UPI003D7D83C7